MGRRISLLALGLATVFMAFAPGAGAKTVELHTFATSFDGHDAVGASTFSAGSLDKVDVDKASGSVIVGAENAIYKFSSSGVSQPFSALAPNTVIQPGINSVGDLAVDNSGGSTQGRVYGFAEYEALNAYLATGAPVGEEFPVPAGGDTCGVAVDADGHVWRHRYFQGIQEYDENGAPTGEEVSTSGGAGYCTFEMDGDGNFYHPSSYFGGAVSKYGPDGTKLATIDANTTSRDVAVDRSTGDIYVDTQSTINHYTAAGEFVESLGTLTESWGVAVDPSSHAVYALANGSSPSVQKFTSSGTATVADVTTESPTEVTREGATAHGTLNPAGVPTTDCRFEYGTVASGSFPDSVPCAEGSSFSGSGTTAVSAVLTGAEPATAYQYRLVVANGNGPSYGTIESFETIAAVKDTTTGEATAIGREEATLNGSFDPDGIETHYWFEYSTNFSYGNKVPLPVPPGGEGGSGSGTVEVSETITGLLYGTSPEGTLYRYRLVAENSLGKTIGAGKTFRTLPAVKGVETLPAGPLTSNSITLNGKFDPDGEDTHYYFQWGRTASYGNYAPVEPPGVDGGEAAGSQTVSAMVTGLEAGATYHYRLVAVNSHGTTLGKDATARPSEAPTITNDRVTEVNTDTAVLEASINPNSEATSYVWEYGPEDCSVITCGQTAPASVGSGIVPVEVRYTLEGLSPGTTYHFRLIATNDLGSRTGDDHAFLTFALDSSGSDACPNVLARKQTTAAATRHCRAYELVSAADTGGYDVESNLIAGLNPLPGFPYADGKALYTVRFGAIPGSGNPTNNGGDPYVATRGDGGWTTRYVGLQATGTPSAHPFASTLLEADQGLDAFAFGGPETCDPCFGDGSTNIPLRLPDGSLVKGMAGSQNPAAEPAGEIAKHFSGDGRHFVFGSTSRFEPEGNNGSLTIYERDLSADTTQVVSTMPDGSTMPGSGTVELDISHDGSRVLIGRQIGTDAAGNPYYALYMHVGTDRHSVLIADTPTGVLFSGMSSDGSKVYFTTPDPLAGDADSGADLFRADVSGSAATVARVSTGGGGAGNGDGCDPAPNADGEHWNEPGATSTATCGVAAIGGGGGVASTTGTAYFLSPENLDPGSDAVADQPNLYAAGVGSAPLFIATLDPDNPLVRDAIAAAGKRETADFQTTPDGKFSVFDNATALTANPTAGHAEIYRGEVGGALRCVSCLPTNGAPASDTFLTEDGLNLVGDGRVFFTSSEQLVLRDTNHLADAYEWENGEFGLISTGLNSTDSGLLTASADGRDAFFFTRQTLAPQDQNGGAMKIYDAREGGGFLYNPPPRSCVASDECHGPGTQQAPPPAINTIEGTGEPQPARQKRIRCGKRKVRRHNKCVKRHKHRRKHHRHHRRRGRHHKGKGRHHG